MGTRVRPCPYRCVHCLVLCLLPPHPDCQHHHSSLLLPPQSDKGRLLRQSKNPTPKKQSFEFPRVLTPSSNSIRHVPAASHESTGPFTLLLRLFGGVPSSYALGPCSEEGGTSSEPRFPVLSRANAMWMTRTRACTQTRTGQRRASLEQTPSHPLPKQTGRPRGLRWYVPSNVPKYSSVLVDGHFEVISTPSRRGGQPGQLSPSA